MNLNSALHELECLPLDNPSHLDGQKESPFTVEVTGEIQGVEARFSIRYPSNSVRPEHLSPSLEEAFEEAVKDLYGHQKYQKNWSLRCIEAYEARMATLREFMAKHGIEVPELPELDLPPK